MSETRIQQTGTPEVIEASDGRLTLSVPIQIKRRSGRKLVTLPNGETVPVRPWDTAPSPLQQALARGHRWLALLTSGEAQSIKEIAAHEGVNGSYVGRMLNLTTPWLQTSWPPSWTTRCPATARCWIWRSIRRSWWRSRGGGLPRGRMLRLVSRFCAWPVATHSGQCACRHERRFSGGKRSMTWGKRSPIWTKNFRSAGECHRRVLNADHSRRQFRYYLLQHDQ